MTSEDIIAFTVQHVEVVGKFEAMDKDILPRSLHYTYDGLMHKLKRQYMEQGYQVVGDPVLVMRIEGHMHPPLDEDLLDVVESVLAPEEGDV